ncbi:MAG: c-type cytochrome [Rhodoferax sp.]|nr:c-type cytochrome [Rhodoferax sp.]
MKKLVFAHCALLMALVSGQSSMAQTVEGNVTNGRQKVAQCIGCHGLEGYHASFPEVYRVPKIAGQGAKYIVSALTAYQKGERRHPTMRGVTSNLNAQDIADVAAYYATLGAASAQVDSGAVRANASAMTLIEKGGCKSCHGDNLSTPVDPSFPKIAGQYADFLLVALKSYKTEPNAVVGRGNPVMGGIAKQFSTKELKVMADYIGSLPGELKVVQESRFR